MLFDDTLRLSLEPLIELKDHGEAGQLELDLEVGLAGRLTIIGELLRCLAARLGDEVDGEGGMFEVELMKAHR